MSQNKSLTRSNFMAINLACGGKICDLTGWINADHNPGSKNVINVNLLKSLPFSENTFDIVYHSQFIEHLPITQAKIFLKECCRVLKPNGLLRVVTPDLKDQTSEYLKCLQEIILAPDNEEVKLRYTWIRLEMLDQLTRHKSGGDMVSFLSKSGIKSQNYLRDRLGVSGDRMIPAATSNAVSDVVKFPFQRLRIIRDRLKNIINKIIPEAYLVGKFRLSGEVHICMYDQYLLSSLLAECGFSNIECVNWKQSRIMNWGETLLDSDEHGNPDCPASLFMEATKVLQSNNTDTQASGD